MNKKNQTGIFPITIVWMFFNVVILIGKAFLKDYTYDWGFLFWSNGFLFLISIGGFLLQRKGLNSVNPHAFVRGVYSSMIFKMFVCMIVVLVYVFLFRNKINKPGLFTAMGMYIVYTVVEVSTLMKVARNKDA